MAKQDPKKTTKPAPKPAAKTPVKRVIPEYEKDKLNTGVKFFDNYINGVRKRMETDTNSLEKVFPFKKGGAMKKMAKGGSTKKK
jgi:hypothetical protein